MAKILFLAGSARVDSVNKKLAILGTNIAKEQGSDAEFIDLADYVMPIFDEDSEKENGTPEAALRLKKKFQDADGFFIASPEYNSGYSPLLKNSIDWMSRPAEEGEQPLSAFSGKVAAISAASPGGLGGIRGLVQLRLLLSNISVHVIPEQAAIGGAFSAFDENGNLSDKRQSSMFEKVISSLVSTAKALKG